MAPFDTVVPNFKELKGKPIKYKIKRSWKVDGRLVRDLRASGSNEIRPDHIRKKEKYLPKQVPEIQSVEDFEFAVVKIIKALIVNSHKQYTTRADVVQRFYGHYGEPIKTVLERVCSGMKLVDLMQTLPDLEGASHFCKLPLIPQPLLAKLGEGEPDKSLSQTWATTYTQVML